MQVADGRLVWSGQFQYPDTNYAGVVPALVAVIADSLRLQLSSGLRSDVLRHTTVDPVVLDLVLRAGRGWLQGIAGAEGDSATIDSSRMLYSRVLERDPNNARAIAGLGDFYSISFIRGWGVGGLSPAEVKERADSLVYVATLRLDSTLPGAWNQVTVDRLYLEDDFDGSEAGAGPAACLRHPVGRVLPHARRLPPGDHGRLGGSPAGVPPGGRNGIRA